CLHFFLRGRVNLLHYCRFSRIYVSNVSRRRRCLLLRSRQLPKTLSSYQPLVLLPLQTATAAADGWASLLAHTTCKLWVETLELPPRRSGKADKNKPLLL